MDNVSAPPCLPVEVQARLDRFLPSLPHAWRVASARPAGQDWMVSLTDATGAVIAQIVLLGERSAEDTSPRHIKWPGDKHGAQPWW
jgi:hypothetical protein